MITAMLWCLLVAISSGNRAEQHVTVDLIEFNKCTYPYGSTLEQVIFWRWNPTYARYEVRGWVTYESVQRIGTDQIVYCPRLSVAGGAVRYIVRGRRAIDTSTDYDPEVFDKRLLAEQYREVMPWNNSRSRDAGR